MRIASLAPSATVMLQELGMADSIVACTHVCPLPFVLRQKLAIGSFSVLNEEKLAASSPDLVITATLVQARGQQRLRERGYTVLHLDPRRLIDIADNYSQLGAFVGRTQEGQRLHNEFLEQLDQYQVPVTVRQLADQLQVYMEEWHEPAYVSGNWVPDIVALAGGQSVLINPGQPSREVSLAELLTADPDVIIQHVCLPPNRDWSVHRQGLATALRQRPGWERLRAVREGRVIPLDDTPFNMPTRGVLEGVKILREVLMKVGATAS